METYTNLYTRISSYDNLELAWRKARKRKTLKYSVAYFESDLENNLKRLQHELESLTYVPSPVTNFIVRDPKTRKINASHFRDRIVHHALCNVISPIFERQFIHDSFANQINKGTHKAVKRAETFMRKVRLTENMAREKGQLLLSKRNRKGYALKADILHYFDTVDQEILSKIIGRRINDANVMRLIKLILHSHNFGIKGKGMPLGNLTSQFFANIYLNELDQFVKHDLKVKYYLRYVDDFIIFHRDKTMLRNYKIQISQFLERKLGIKMHAEKSRIMPLENGITFLGFRIFQNYKLLKKSNTRRIWKRLEIFEERYDNGTISQTRIKNSLDGWLAYSRFANTYNLRKRVLFRVNRIFCKERSCLNEANT